MGERDAAVPAGLRVRATRALRERRNWEQLAKFCIVGALGYAVNLVICRAPGRGELPLPARRNGIVPRRRHEQLSVEPALDFPARPRALRLPGAALPRLSGVVYLCNLAILTILVELGLGKIVAQAIAIVLVTPANFIGNKLWSFRRQR